jgi:hypothetical protein
MADFRPPYEEFYAAVKRFRVLPARETSDERELNASSRAGRISIRSDVVFVVAAN